MYTSNHGKTPTQHLAAHLRLWKARSCILEAAKVSSLPWQLRQRSVWNDMGSSHLRSPMKGARANSQGPSTNEIIQPVIAARTELGQGQRILSRSGEGVRGLVARPGPNKNKQILAKLLARSSSLAVASAGACRPACAKKSLVSAFRHIVLNEQTHCNIIH